MSNTIPNKTSTLSSFFTKMYVKSVGSASKKYEHIFDRRKKTLFSELKGILVEIGPGTGANLPYFPDSISYIGIEREKLMGNELARELKEKKFSESRILNTSAEHIPLPSESVDIVVGTEVLCSILDPERALSEIKRILKIGGTYLFIEHIAAEEGTLTRKLQRLFKKPCGIIGRGCNPERETEKLIREAGFSQIEVEREHMPMIRIVSPHIFGKATK